VYTVAGGVLENGTVVIERGKITAVGDAARVAVPSGAEVRDVSGKVIIPGLVDTHSHVAIRGDTNEGSGPVQPGLRALDAIDPMHPSVRMAQAGGVTTANIMPGSGNVMGGQTAYVKMRGRTIDEMLICGDPQTEICGGMKMANGENPKGYGRRGQEPMTRMAVAALQREIFVKAQNYKAKWDAYREAARRRDRDAKAPDRDLELDPVVEILERKRTVHFHTHRADDIRTAMRLADEFGFDLVLQHVTEAYKVADAIARRNVPASIILIDSPGGKHEAADFRLENGAILEKAGVKVAIHTDDWITESRLFLRSGALAVRGGMSPEGALRALTLAAAEMMGLAGRVGSIEQGKDADLVVLSGEPFSVYTHVLETWIEGEKVFDRTDSEDRRYATGGYRVDDYPELAP
jgi:imidazolonepropionase-like amidohydrolase